MAGILGLGSLLFLSMNAEEKAKASREARERSERCRDWLRSNFDTGWDWAIWDMGREDWYEPLPRRRSKLQ
jgi:hypothetical protein